MTASKLADMSQSLQNALDQLCSPRSSPEAQSQALENIERRVAQACLEKDGCAELECFTALQYTFECNVSSRLLSWICSSTLRLETMTNRDKGLTDRDQDSDVSKLSQQLSLSLSLIQGVALIHPSSKFYLGRRYSLEVLLDLLLASRHVSARSESAETPSPGAERKVNMGSPPLTSIVLDTLLCVLVDSSSSLRAFEGVRGVQAIVKILKRAGTPREVRMKCLEFLYFYLLDETEPALAMRKDDTQTDATNRGPATATSTRPLKPYLNATPLHPSSRNGSSTLTFSFPPTASSSSRSTSGSSAHSFSSSSSLASSLTTLPSRSPSPEKKPKKMQLRTPPKSVLPLLTEDHAKLQPRSLMMLKREVDFIPSSPKKTQVARLGIGGTPRQMVGKSGSERRSRLVHSDESNSPNKTFEGGDIDSNAGGSSPLEFSGKRTAEEKKQLLGTMLGNVDALVEGVRKAGIWGLG